MFLLVKLYIPTSFTVISCAFLILAFVKLLLVRQFDLCNYENQFLICFFIFPDETADKTLIEKDHRCKQNAYINK